MVSSRRLFTLVVRDYPHSADGFTAGVDHQLDVLRRWWCAPDLGDRALTEQDLGPVHHRRDVEEAIHKTGLRELAEHDVAVVYITGHGVRGNSGRHYLALPATPHGEYLAHGYPTADLITAALASKARHLLVIANSCFSGQLETELSALRKDLPPGRGLGTIEVFATADFDQMPRVREFADLLAEVHRYLRSDQAGYTEQFLSMDEFALELHQAHHRLGLLEPRRLLKPLISPERSPCLPNPGYQPVRHIVGPALEQVATDADELDYWLDRATGRTSPTDPGWYFAGRTALTIRIADFLRTGRGLLLVTGAAGTGKSAIVARTVTLSDPGFRDDPRYRTALAAALADTLPPSGSITAAVLARNKNSDEIAEHLIRALGATPTAAPGSTTRTTELRTQLISLAEQGDRVTTIVVDGVDEATDPTRLIIDLVGPLLRRTGSNAPRLIIGVRSATPHSDDRDREDGGHELLDLLHRFPAPVTELRTDHDSASDITTYLANLLADRYPEPDRDILAARIAAVVAPSFLDARFAGQRLRTLPTPPGPHDLLASLNLHDGTLGLLRRDLHDTATPDYTAPALLAALRATAFALGAGVPWADIWTAIATAVHDSPVSDDTISHLLHSRLGGYLTRDTADDRTVYRPVHETLAETLRDHPERLVGDPDAR